MVDHVVEIPLPGRTLCAPGRDRAESAPRFAVPSFVAGPENGVLASAVEALLPEAIDASAVATPPILTIFGASGTGKTHLARGLVRSWQERWGDDCAEYLTASDFRHALREAIDKNAVREFRNRIRTRRLLAIDELDRLPADEYLQQELRYTIDALAENGGTLVVASSSAAGALRNLSADLRSRLAAGLTLRLAPPEDAARQRIIRHVTSALGQPMSDAAVAQLAAGVGGTANDVFGAVFELNADPAATQTGGESRQIDRYLTARSARKPTLPSILRTVGKHYDVPQKVLKSSSRRQKAVTARAMVVYLARELAGTSYQRIGAALGGRDHTTMLHNYRKVADAVGSDAALRDEIDQLQSSLRGGCE